MFPSLVCFLRLACLLARSRAPAAWRKGLPFPHLILRTSAEEQGDGREREEGRGRRRRR